MPKKSTKPSICITGEQITTYVWLSRLHQLSLELRTTLKSKVMVANGGILHVMFLEGWIDKDLRSTRRNKAMIYQLMLEKFTEIMRAKDPEWEPSFYHKRLIQQLKQEGHIK